MKKIILAMYLALISATGYSQVPNIQNVALNGLDMGSFNQTQSYFAEHKDEDNRPDIASVWFSAPVIKKMVEMFKKDSANHRVITDGVRIYFVADPNSPPFLKTSIILVSTKYDPDPNRTSDHRDYYDHDVNDPFFKDDPAAIKGELSNDNCKGEALLYTKSNEPDPDCIKNDPHYVRRSDAEDMVIRFRDKKHVINTISEWYDIKLFEDLVNDGNYDGIRIYFSRRKGFLGILTGRNSFLITTTNIVKGVPRTDEFGCLANNPFMKRYNKHKAYITPPQDNGELCPNNCN